MDEDFEVEPARGWCPVCGLVVDPQQRCQGYRQRGGAPARASAATARGRRHRSGPGRPGVAASTRRVG